MTGQFASNLPYEMDHLIPLIIETDITDHYTTLLQVSWSNLLGLITILILVGREASGGNQENRRRRMMFRRSGKFQERYKASSKAVMMSHYVPYRKSNKNEEEKNIFVIFEKVDKLSAVLQ
ncbi:hypothetical protein NQ317_014479 [Molorchus minor]|uniref:Uncharacterized protein n=1 Tax=Molorchus minor TaxID=1323400 RepID=A0ABQ9J8J4_9CUCU|nr:hypothetical protein NQ317_014479 [Molorchus minor]